MILYLSDDVRCAASESAAKAAELENVSILSFIKMGDGKIVISVNVLDGDEDAKGYFAGIIDKLRIRRARNGGKVMDKKGTRPLFKIKATTKTLSGCAELPPLKE